MTRLCPTPAASPARRPTWPPPRASRSASSARPPTLPKSSRLPRVAVEELRLDESDLNTKRMLDLMAVSSVQGGGMPLYLHVVARILRDLRIDQQKSGGNFDYTAFRRTLELQDLTPGQMSPLQQRLDTLESFMPREQVRAAVSSSRKSVLNASKRAGNDWTPKPGQLTIMDLSCPYITQETACALFNICLSLFLEQDLAVGLVIALDEAHKYMTDSPEYATLTETLLATIRLQRHLDARVVISTQEPTVSPKLLDLCSVTIVHRFTSPSWFRSWKQHLTGANNLAQGIGQPSLPSDAAEFEQELLSQILSLKVGEGLLFAPSALVGLARPGPPGAASALVDLLGDGGAEPEESREPAEEQETDGSPPDMKPVLLGPRPMKIRVRKLLTADGGRTVMAA